MGAMNIKVTSLKINRITTQVSGNVFVLTVNHKIYHSELFALIREHEHLSDTLRCEDDPYYYMADEDQNRWTLITAPDTPSCEYRFIVEGILSDKPWRGCDVFYPSNPRAMLCADVCPPGKRPSLEPLDEEGVPL